MDAKVNMFRYSLDSITRDEKLGVQLLTQLFKDCPPRGRECLYYLAVGGFKLGDYTNARKYCDIVLESYNKTNCIFIASGF